MMHKYLILNLVFVYSGIHCQIQFFDKTNFYGINHTYGIGQAGGGVSFADFDDDGLDDLTFASSGGNEIYFFRNTGTGLEKLNLLPHLKEEVKHILWVDYDNDGDQDLFITLADSYNRLYNNQGSLNLVDVTQASGFSDAQHTSFGACWGDINRDGYLDVYFGQRRIENTGEPNISRLFLNERGVFTEITGSSGTEDGGKTPFCSSFIDFDNDKWPDIYTAHDRLRGNTLLRNLKNNTFTDVSTATKSGLKMDGMSVSAYDYNNDGYFDIYVSNTEAGNALFVNNKGIDFEENAAQCNVGFNSIAWGTNFLDGDLDGDLDLYVSGMLVGKDVINSQYFENQFPDNKFIKGSKIQSDTVSSFNNAVGDINNDGYPDIAVINLGYPSFIFENIATNNNNFIKIKLQGVYSNKNGIGSKIVVYCNGKPQYRYTQIGTGFMGQNSLTEIFGLGKQTVADSLLVIWPTGHKDVLYNLSGNQLHTIVEGQSTNGIISVDNDITLLTKTRDIKNETKVTIFPNPVKAGQAILMSSAPGICYNGIDLIDASGIKLATLGLSTSDKINIPNGLPSGPYFMVFKYCNGHMHAQSIQIIE